MRGSFAFSVRPLSLLLLVILLETSAAFGQGQVLDSALSDSYHYVDRHEILIEATLAEVWPRLLDLGAWMEGFSLQHHAGPEQGEGSVYRLYEGQDFFFEIVKLIPERLILGVNLPSEMEGELSVGTAMFSLSETENGTLVSLFMSRLYDWPEGGENPILTRRRSEDFADFNSEMYGSFLARLRSLVEQAPQAE